MHNENDFSFSKGYVGLDECILWKGKPVPGKHLISAKHLSTMVLCIFFCAFSVYWIITAIKNNTGFYPFVGIAFFIIGLLSAALPVMRVYRCRKNTAYIITDKQILRNVKDVVSRLPAAEVHSMGVVINKDGIGTIAFDSHISAYGSDTYRKISGISCLENIPDAEKVHQILKSLKK